MDDGLKRKLNNEINGAYRPYTADINYIHKFDR